MRGRGEGEEKKEQKEEKERDTGGEARTGRERRRVSQNPNIENFDRVYDWLGPSSTYPASISLPFNSTSLFTRRRPYGVLAGGRGVEGVGWSGR